MKTFVKSLGYVLELLSNANIYCNTNEWGEFLTQPLRIKKY